ncbi:patatin-like phospholipase family protein [Pelagibaculum spongiae]|uniref:Uncharacterized protein n=1 Tax=Pelagibaculum spongiae TaxID=2080658 RepID=A0A2V1GTP0_9GAMM|nr:patatin-like phospholipase family protein [Pelagibaculum spongiae]PVZ66390.1 hypothetical protein DC094_16990 [Pelagibaculum spongiae]
MTDLTILAGKTAYQKIKDGGLSAQDIGAVIGASGAAKWLAIYGLDCAIFGHWLKDLERPVTLYGTSIGAWKLAAASRTDPIAAMEQLAEVYTQQRFTKKTSKNDVLVGANQIIESFLPAGSEQEIISNPNLRYSCGIMRSLGGFATDSTAGIVRGMAGGFMRNFAGRQYLKPYIERYVFHDPRSLPGLSASDGIACNHVALSEQNMQKVVLAAGSIPYMLPAVENIPGAPVGLYRDGGLLDYHPLMNFLPGDDRLALYPHFYDYFIPTWFDKKFKKRHLHHHIPELDNVVLLAPSRSFVEKLPYQRIPDRKDFKAMIHQYDDRVKFWNTTQQRSHQLGDQFMEAVISGKIRDHVQLIPAA